MSAVNLLAPVPASGAAPVLALDATPPSYQESVDRDIKALVKIIILLLDHSGSMEGPREQSARNIGVKYLNEGAQVFLFTTGQDFDNKLRFYPFDMTTKPPMGLTPLWKAIEEKTQEAILKMVDGNHVTLLVQTDGEETCGGTPDKMTRLLQDIILRFPEMFAIKIGFTFVTIPNEFLTLQQKFPSLVFVMQFGELPNQYQAPAPVFRPHSSRMCGSSTRGLDDSEEEDHSRYGGPTRGCSKVGVLIDTESEEEDASQTTRGGMRGMPSIDSDDEDASQTTRGGMRGEPDSYVDSNVAAPDSASQLLSSVDTTVLAFNNLEDFFRITG